MELRKPTLDDEEKLDDYVLEHYNNGEYSINGSNMLPVMEYDDWVKKIDDDWNGLNSEWGLNETYILVDEEKVIGIINIRYNSNANIVKKYGHIGYSVRPSMRRKGMAMYMLREALIKCREYGLDEVILGCYKDNLGSVRTIVKNNGILDREDYMDGKETQYYKIKIKIKDGD